MLAQSNPGPSRPDPSIQGKVIETYGKLPLSFEANQGQTDDRVRFLSRGSGYTLFLTGDEAVFSLQGSKVKNDTSPSTHRLHQSAVGPTTDAVLRMKLVNPNQATKVSGADELPDKSNYFIGNDSTKWHSNVANYAKVKYEGIYPGIDLIYYGNQRQLEYDFVIAPGADAHRIQFDIRGASKISKSKDGDLVLHFPDGELRWRKPIVYQERNGERQAIDGRYLVRHGHRVSFEIGSYDPTRVLTIDPALAYSTFFGATTGFVAASAVTVDTAGNAYLAGYTRAWDFPTTPGAFQTTCPSGTGQYGCGDWGAAFITKMNPTGTALVYSTYLGGNQGAQGEAIAIDSAGDAYVTGGTYSNNFPTTPGVVQPTCTNCGYNTQTILGDVFVTELNPTGSALIYSTYLGGDVATGYSIQNGSGIAIDRSGDAYVAGSTNSAIFPTTPGAFQTKCGSCNTAGNNNAFVTEFNSTGTALIYSTYLGGSASDEASAMALDSFGDVYLTGAATSTDFPVTPGAFQSTCSEPYCRDAFVTQLNPTGSALIYSTYLGGGVINQSGEDQVGAGIAVSSSGNAYITGFTDSADFPVTPGAFQTTCRACTGGINAFVTEFNSAGSALIYSTYLGGSTQDEAFGIVLDAAGDVYLNGYTLDADFPTTPGSFQPTCGTCTFPTYYGFMSELNPSGSTLLYSTYLTGSNTSYSTSTVGRGLAIDAANGVYLVGSTDSSTFPITPGVFQTQCAGGCFYGNTFVAKFVPGDQVWPLSLTFGNQTIGVASTPQSTVLSNSGAATLTITSITFTGANSADFSEQDNCGTSLAAGLTCTINVTFTPTAPGSRSAALNITDSAANSPQTVALSGVGTVTVTVIPSNLNFGAEGLGSTSQPQPVTLSTNGTLIINSIFANPPFAQTNNCGTGLPAGGNCTINVSFTPQVLGLQNGTLTISDDATGSPQTVGLAGTGVSPVALNPTSLNFGNQTVGATSAPMTTTLTNVGIVAVTITSIVITGPNSSAFAQMNNCPTSLAPNGSCTISVTFTPTMLQSYSASLTVNDNALGSPTIAPLSGTGSGPIFMISPPNLTFPEQYVGTSGLPQSVTLTNNGNGPLLITAVTTSPADFGSLNACGASVAVGASCAIGVFFDPAVAGTRNGILSITDNAAGSPQTVALTGVGQDFSMAPSGPSTATVSPGGTATYALTVEPAGGFKQTVSFTCSGAPTGFVCSVPSSVALSGSTSTKVTVTVTTAATSGSLTPLGGLSPSGGRLAMWLALGGLPGLVIVGTSGVGSRRRQRRLLCGLAFLCLFSVGITWTGCGGGGSIGGGTSYNLTVTGTFTSGTAKLIHNTNLTLLVQ
jgi:hypothetical protein